MALTGKELVAVTGVSPTGGQASTQELVPTQEIADLGGAGSVPRSPFFGTALQTGWTRPGLDVGGSTPNCFTAWLNQGGQAVGVGTDDPPANGTPTDPGTGAVPGQVDTLSGGTLLAAGNLPTPTATQITVTDTQVVSVVINSVGSGGTPGPATLTGTTGTGTTFQCTVVIQSNGTLTGAPAPVLTVPGDYTVNPTSLSAEPVTSDDAGPLTGATVTLTMGALLGAVTRVGGYAVPPANPVAGSNGRTWTLLFSDLATISCATGNSPVSGSKTAQPLLLATESVGSANLSLLTGILMPIGVPPWEITVGVAGVLTCASPQTPAWAPIILFNSAENKAVTLTWYEYDYPTPRPAVSLRHYDQLISTEAPTDVVIKYTSSGYFVWFRISNDGTNLTFSVSFEGLYFQLFAQEAANAFVSSFDYVGTGFDSKASLAGDQAAAPIWNWVQTSP